MSKITHLELEGGIHVTTFVEPPAGFDPFTAHESALVKHGFPAIPKDPAQLKMYQELMSRIKHKFQYIVPTFSVNPSKTHGPRKKGLADGSETSGNWSGGVLHAAAGKSLSCVTGQWVIPNVDAPTENKWYYASSWIGLDGDGSPDVCQAGVECEAYRVGSNVTTNIYPWWEWYPLYEVKITNLSVRPGDLVTMTISTSGPGATTASVSFANVTLGVATSFQFSAPSGTKLVGNCAEWIVEAPTVGGGQTAIADYGQVFFANCSANAIASATGNNISLSANNAVVSSGTLVASNIVECLYLGAQP